MERLRWVQMPDAEREDFLGSGGTGVLSFAVAEGSPYAVPVSYGYVADTGDFHFRLSESSGSEKGRFVGRPVTFVTYGETADDGWRSVVASGELEDLSELDEASAAVQERWAVDIPLVDIFEEPPESVAFRPYRLVPASVTGRKSVEASE